jgi:NAD(P)-dependent dehydrogenase (short-subunit alcohol dehydrogenase family)
MENASMTLAGKKFVVTGGSRGLGLGIVEALAEAQALVTVVARDDGRLAEVKRRLGVAVVQGDITDQRLASELLGELRPDGLILNAGIHPRVAPFHEQTWESFSAPWETDMKGGFHWVQAALRTPLPPGSRVLIGSSGAALAGSPLSGGYAGAKRMLWLLAGYASGVSTQLGLGIRFQALLPAQLVGETELGRTAAEAYARRQGITTEAFLAGFGAPMPPRRYGEWVRDILTDGKYADASAFAIKGEGIRPLEPRLA